MLNTLSSQKYPCLIAGDIKIDLTKCKVNKQTAEYVDMLLMNNFVPTVTMPTRITSHSATLINHMYYCEGKKPSEFMEQESGNFLHNLSDLLPYYGVLLNKNITTLTARPLIKIFSQKNEDEFLSILNSVNWDICVV